MWRSRSGFSSETDGIPKIYWGSSPTGQDHVLFRGLDPVGPKRPLCLESRAERGREEENKQVNNFGGLILSFDYREVKNPNQNQISRAQTGPN